MELGSARQFALAGAEQGRDADRLRERIADLCGQTITDVAGYEVATAQSMGAARA